MSTSSSVSAPLSRGNIGLIAVVVAGGIVMSVAMGIRQSFGLYLGPFTIETGVPYAAFALTIAIHNLVWGLSQPFAGAAADRYGTAPVVIVGSLIFAAGLALTSVYRSELVTLVGFGVLVGIGLSATTFGIILSSVGRSASAERRTTIMGITSALGSVGQAVIVPFAQFGIDRAGAASSLLWLGLLVLAASPLGLVFLSTERKAGDQTTAALAGSSVSLGEILREACTHRGYGLLTLGFFTCGFQLAFINTHLPGYVATCHLPAAVGAAALSAFALSNAVGSWCCGFLGSRFRPQFVLACIYVLRTAAIAALLLLPKTPLVVIGFAAFTGFIALGTVPLTSGLIARIFGVTNLGLLFGICFLSHQIGSFFGAWAGGVVFEATGSYDMIWIFTGVAGLFAAALHVPIKDEPLIRRPAAATSAG
jgi:MFS family permease